MKVKKSKIISKIYEKRQRFPVLVKQNVKKSQNSLPLCYNNDMSTKSILLSLDISTTATGYAIFDLKTKKLLRFGLIEPKVPNIHKMKYPEAPLYRILDMSSQIRDLVEKENPQTIVIEEVNRGINRLSQKSLDAVHFFVLDHLRSIGVDCLKSVCYMDSNGKISWRGKLGLKLSDADKKTNATIRKSKNKEGIINWKTLAIRYANNYYGLELDEKKDDDVADAICMGTAFLQDK